MAEFSLYSWQEIDVAKLPNRAQSSQQYLTEAINLLQTGNVTAAVENILYVRDCMLPVIDDQLRERIGLRCA